MSSVSYTHLDVYKRQLKIIASGYARSRQMTVLTKESSRDKNNALECSGVAMDKTFARVKAPDLSVSP